MFEKGLLCAECVGGWLTFLVLLDFYHLDVAVWDSDGGHVSKRCIISAHSLSLLHLLPLIFEFQKPGLFFFVSCFTINWFCKHEVNWSSAVSVLLNLKYLEQQVESASVRGEGQCFSFSAWVIRHKD